MYINYIIHYISKIDARFVFVLMMCNIPNFTEKRIFLNKCNIDNYRIASVFTVHTYGFFLILLVFYLHGIICLCYPTLKKYSIPNVIKAKYLLRLFFSRLLLQTINYWSFSIKRKRDSAYVFYEYLPDTV